jgi:hypothetical protein
MAEAHYAFCQLSAAADPLVRPVEKFGDCYFYGGSTHNQRIERWWGQLQMSQLGAWRVSYAIVRFLYYITN